MPKRDRIACLTYSQRQRLVFIDFCLEYVGHVSRIDLAEHFGLGVTSCSRDFAIYRELAGENLVLRHADKQYIRTKVFHPLFNHSPDAVLVNLTRGFGDGISATFPSCSACFDVVNLNYPNPMIIAGLMRAILHGETVDVIYISLNQGKTERTIVPHAIINSGQRWHVRAYDRKSKSFCDFVCARVEKVHSSKPNNKEREKPVYDKEWNEEIELIIRPNPQIKHPEAIEREYKMQNGELRVSTRAALAPYLLLHWQVNLSNDNTFQQGSVLFLSNVDDIPNSKTVLQVRDD
jgi:hypothetical protein